MAEFRIHIYKEEPMVLDDELDLECEESKKIPSFMLQQVNELLVLFMGRQFGSKCSISVPVKFEIPVLFNPLSWSDVQYCQHQVCSICGPGRL